MRKDLAEHPYSTDRVLLFLPGGGAKAIYQFGLCVGLMLVGVDLARTVAVVGSSAGGLVGTCFVSGLGALISGAVASIRGAKEKSYYRATRWWRPADIGSVVSRTEINELNVQSSLCEVRLVATNSTTGETTLIDPRQVADIHYAIEAACRLPGFAFTQPVRIGDQRYFDGDVCSWYPAEAIKHELGHLNFTEVIVIECEPVHRLPTVSRLEALAVGFAFRWHPRVAASYFKRAAATARGHEQLRNWPGAEFFELRPPNKKIGPLTTDPIMMLEAFNDSALKVVESFGRPELAAEVRRITEEVARVAGIVYSC
jgi:predicted patatin/cPLA2 family phospholipase